MNPSEPDDVTRPADTDEPAGGDVAEPAETPEPIDADGPAAGENEPDEAVAEAGEPAAEPSEPGEPVEEAADPVEPVTSLEQTEPVETGGATGQPDTSEPDPEPVVAEPGPMEPDATGPDSSGPDFTGAGLPEPDPAEPDGHGLVFGHEFQGQEPDPPEPDVLFAPDVVFAPDPLTPDAPEPTETFAADQPDTGPAYAETWPAHAGTEPTYAGTEPTYTDTEPTYTETWPAHTDAESAHVALPAEMTVPAEMLEPVATPAEPEPPAEGAEPVEPGRAPRRRGTRRADRRAHRSSVDLEQVVDFVGYRYATAVLVVLALLALYGVAALSRPAATAQTRGGHAPITSAVLGCPAPAGARVSALTPRPAGAAGSGRADITDTQRGTAVNSLATPGVSWSQDVRAGRTPQAYTVRARDALAAGLEVEQTSAVTKGADRGLAGVRCTEPGTDMWFLGPGPVDAKDIQLHLINVDAQPAVVDTLALSGEGPLDTLDGRGTTVAPHSRQIVRIGGSAAGLGELVNSARLVALRVRATTGRVAAAVRVRVDKGKGVDWLPLTSAPATEVVVPGIPSGDGRRKLLVAVPGDSDARIRVQVITASGAFAPEGQDTLDAPAQTVTPVDLERALSGKPAAVRLTSDRPITAGFVAQRGADVAYGSATRPLGAAGGVIADNRAETSVLLTAPETGATVRVTAVTAQGAAGSPQDVRIGAGRTVEVRMPAPPGAENGFGVLLGPVAGSGPVHAARVLSMGKGDGRLLTVLPVVPALLSVPQPRVGDSLTSLIP